MGSTRLAARQFFSLMAPRHNMNPSGAVSKILTRLAPPILRLLGANGMNDRTRDVTKAALSRAIRLDNQALQTHQMPLCNERHRHRLGLSSQPMGAWVRVHL